MHKIIKLCDNFVTLKNHNKKLDRTNLYKQTLGGKSMIFYLLLLFTFKINAMEQNKTQQHMSIKTSGPISGTMIAGKTVIHFEHVDNSEFIITHLSNNDSQITLNSQPTTDQFLPNASEEKIVDEGLRFPEQKGNSKIFGILFNATGHLLRISSLKALMYHKGINRNNYHDLENAQSEDSIDLPPLTQINNTKLFTWDFNPEPQFTGWLTPYTDGRVCKIFKITSRNSTLPTHFLSVEIDNDIPHHIWAPLWIQPKELLAYAEEWGDRDTNSNNLLLDITFDGTDNLLNKTNIKVNKNNN